MRDRFLRILAAVAADPECPLAELPLEENGETEPVEGTMAQDFALVLDLVEAGGGLIGTFSYNQALFDSTTALRWRGHLEALLAGVAADPARPLTELPLLSEGERHQVTFEWGEAVHVDGGGPAPIGIWGELAGAPAPAGLAEPAAKRKLLAKRIRGER